MVSALFGAALLVSSAAAAPLRGGLGVEIGSGFESNVFYTGETADPVGDGFLEVAPAAGLKVVLAPGLRFVTDWAGSLRGYLDAVDGTLVYHAGDAGLHWWATDWLRIEVTAGFDHQWGSNDLGGHAIAGFGEIALAAAWDSGEVEVGYRAHGRTWLDADPERHEVSHLPRVQLYQSVAPWLSFLAGYQLGPRDADVDGYDLFSHRLLLGAVVSPVSGLRVRELYLLYARTFEGTDAPELLHGNRLEVEVTATGWLDVWARWDASVNDADEAARRFVSHTVGAGVGFRWGGATADMLPVHVELALERAPQRESLTPKVVPGGVRFFHRAPRASSVSVVGAFNGWDAASAPMEPVTDDGLWAVTLPVAQGAWEFAFLIDGERVEAPEDTEHLVDSGFGDVNGVLVVQ